MSFKYYQVRMRIIVALVTLTISLVVLVSPDSVVLAQTSANDLIGVVTDPGAVDVGGALVSPASPLYFLKALREVIEMQLAPDASTKAMRQLEFAQRRMRELNSLVKFKQQDLIPPILEHYKLELDQALKFASSNQNLEEKIGEDVSRQMDVLQRAYDQVGNPRAKIAIKTALERAEKLDRDLLSKLNLDYQQKLIKNTAARQAFVCKFFAREATTSVLNEVEREELGQQVKLCEQSVRTDLKDELEDLKSKASPKESEQNRPAASARGLKK